MRGSREISLVPSLHRASTDALIKERGSLTWVNVVEPVMICIVVQAGNPTYWLW